MLTRIGLVVVVTLLVALLWLSAATAGQGWYLMLPPITNGGKIDDSRPLSQWKQEYAFESPSRCQEFKTGRWRHHESWLATNLEANPTERARAKAHTEQIKLALCIASDDPRLVSKP